MCFFMTSFLADNSTDRTKSQEKGGGHPNAEKIFLVENWTKLENENFCEKKKKKKFFFSLQRILFLRKNFIDYSLPQIETQVKDKTSRVRS